MSISVRNQLLLGLSKADRAFLWPHLEPTTLELGAPIEKANTAIRFVYFPDDGIISLVARSTENQIEAALIGREGMSGTAVVLGNHRSPHDAFAHLPGNAHRISAKKLRAALDARRALRQRLQRFAQVLTVQISHTAFANGTARIEERLARWLLMVQDRQDDDEIHLTHEAIASMLGVRRSGVTDALHTLEGRGLVRANRGVVIVVNRKSLIALAKKTYGVPEAEYRRLIG